MNGNDFIRRISPWLVLLPLVLAACSAPASTMATTEPTEVAAIPTESPTDIPTATTTPTPQATIRFHPSQDIRAILVLTKDVYDEDVFEARLEPGEKFLRTDSLLVVECYTSAPVIGQFEWRELYPLAYPSTAQLYGCQFYSIAEAYFEDWDPEPFLLRRTQRLSPWPWPVTPTHTPMPTDTPVPTNTPEHQLTSETPVQTITQLDIEPWVVSKCEQQRCCFDFQNNEGDPPQGGEYAIEFTPVGNETGVGAFILFGPWNTYDRVTGEQYITLYPDNLEPLPTNVAFHWTVVEVINDQVVGRGFQLSDTFVKK